MMSGHWLKQALLCALLCTACSETSGTAPDAARGDSTWPDRGVADGGADVVTPDAPAPDAPAPDAPAPDAPAPDAPAPDAPAPDASLPDTGAVDGPGDAAGDLTGCAPIPDPGNASTCTVNPSGQIAWWRAEGNFNDSAGSLNGTNSGATFTTGKVGQAFAFSGAGQSISLGNTSSLDFTSQDFTLEAWLRLVDLPTLNPGGSGCIPFYPVVANRDWGWSLNISSAGAVSFSKYTTKAGGIGVTSCSAPIPVNTWVHVAAVHATTELRLYLNGVLQGIKASADPVIYYEPTDQPEIGARHCASGIYYLKGALDEISIYNRALSAQEIKTVAAAGDKGKCP